MNNAIAWDYIIFGKIYLYSNIDRQVLPIIKKRSNPIKSIKTIFYVSIVFIFNIKLCCFHIFTAILNIVVDIPFASYSP